MIISCIYKYIYICIILNIIKFADVKHFSYSIDIGRDVIPTTERIDKIWEKSVFYYENIGIDELEKVRFIQAIGLTKCKCLCKEKRKKRLKVQFVYQFC